MLRNRIAAWTRNPATEGKLLLVGSALAFSIAGFFTRVAPVDLWATVFWRNLFGCLVLAVVVAAAEGRSAWSSVLRFGPWGWATIATSALATIFYLAAFATTSVADVSIIYAATPLVTAALAWIVNRERASRVTLGGGALALVGVTLTLGGSLGSGHWVGDTWALAMAVSYAGMTVLTRRGPPRPPLVTAGVASLAAMVAVVPLGMWRGSKFTVAPAAMAWLAVFGTVSMGVALPLYLAGARRIPAAQAALISALELPLAPLWVWLAFGENPGTPSIVGGTLVLLATLMSLLSRT